MLDINLGLNYYLAFAFVSAVEAALSFLAAFLASPAAFLSAVYLLAATFFAAFFAFAAAFLSAFALSLAFAAGLASVVALSALVGFTAASAGLVLLAGLSPTAFSVLAGLSAVGAIAVDLPLTATSLRTFSNVTGPTPSTFSNSSTFLKPPFFCGNQ